MLSTPPRNHGPSCNQAAKQIGIGTAICWARPRVQDGQRCSRQMGDHRPEAISNDHRIWRLQRIGISPCAGSLPTCRALAEGREFVHATKLSLKKSVNTTVSTSRGGESRDQISRSHRP